MKTPFSICRGRFRPRGRRGTGRHEWPTIQHKLAVNPFVLLGGYSPLVTRATLTRDGQSVHVHLSATHEETLRLLAVALHMIGG